MRFHFRHDSGAGSGDVLVHPSYLVVIDAHRDSTSHFNERNEMPFLESHFSSGASRAASPMVNPKSSKKYTDNSQSRTINDNPASDDEDHPPTSSSKHGAFAKSKRALHLEHHEGECPHSRPRSRQFFRLGRHRSRAAAAGASSANAGDGRSFSDSSVSPSSSMSPPPATNRRRGRKSSPPGKPRDKPKVMTLAMPTLRRTMSLPIELHQHESQRKDSDRANDPASKVDAENTGLTASMSATSLSSHVATGDTITPTSTATACPKTHRRHVTFTAVHVREYSRILGDHPCCPSGPPLSLGWEMERQDTFAFEMYEKEREPARRSKDEMRLGCLDRREILANLVVEVPVGSSNAESPAGDSEGVCYEEGCWKTEESAEGDSNSTSLAQAATTTTCCMYSRQEIRKAERRQGRERANNHRAHRKMNKGFFTPLTQAEKSKLEPCELTEMSVDSADLCLESRVPEDSARGSGEAEVNGLEATSTTVAAAANENASADDIPTN